jgi:hypothetical protein
LGIEIVEVTPEPTRISLASVHDRSEGGLRVGADDAGHVRARTDCDRDAAHDRWGSGFDSIPPHCHEAFRQNGSGWAEQMVNIDAMSPRRRDAALQRSAPIFAALGEVTRLRVVARLSDERPLSITQLTEGS